MLYSLLMMDCSPIMIASLGWIVGFLSSVTGTYLLERRRAFRTFISECELLRAHISDDTRFPDFHTQCVDALKRHFFTAAGFLNQRQRKDAREAWAAYQSFDPADFPCYQMHHDVVNDPVTGEKTVTKAAAARRELDAIQRIFADIWP